MTPSTLTLIGDGYTLGITPDAEALKAQILEASKAVTVVADAAGVEAARSRLKDLAGFRLALEKSRKAVKEPVLELGRSIDTKAKEFGGDVEAEESRITRLVTDFAAETERKRREAEEYARKAREEAERLEREKQRLELERQQAELEAQRKQLELERQKLEAAKAAEVAAKMVAPVKKTLAEIMAEKRLEAAVALANQAAYQAAAKVEAVDGAIGEAKDVQIGATEAIIETPRVEGVKPDLDYTVTNAAELYAKFPHLVQLVPMRRQILDTLKSLQAGGQTPSLPGLKVTEVFKVKR